MLLERKREQLEEKTVGKYSMWIVGLRKTRELKKEFLKLVMSIVSIREEENFDLLIFNLNLSFAFYSFFNQYKNKEEFLKRFLDHFDYQYHLFFYAL